MGKDARDEVSGATPSGPGCQPAASAVPASRSGIPSVAHTPGPWEIYKRKKCYAYLMAPKDPHEWRSFARIVVAMEGCDGLAPSPEGEANARLIAAAPEMLKALIAARDAANEMELSSAYFPRVAIEAAIAKATGGAA